MTKVTLENYGGSFYLRVRETHFRRCYWVTNLVIDYDTVKLIVAKYLPSRYQVKLKWEPKSQASKWWNCNGYPCLEEFDDYGYHRINGGDWLPLEPEPMPEPQVLALPEPFEHDKPRIVWEDRD
jgi:hypothetical protein